MIAEIAIGSPKGNRNLKTKERIPRTRLQIAIGAVRGALLAAKGNGGGIVSSPIATF
jgi:hypothetical protein